MCDKNSDDNNDNCNDKGMTCCASMNSIEVYGGGCGGGCGGEDGGEDGGGCGSAYGSAYGSAFAVDGLLDMKRDVILRLSCYVGIPTLRSLMGMCNETYKMKSHKFFHNYPIPIQDRTFYLIYEKIVYRRDKNLDQKCFSYRRLKRIRTERGAKTKEEEEKKEKEERK
jgi:hypothetical protein